MKLMINGRVEDVQDSYAARMVEQGQATVYAAPTAEKAEKPKKAAKAAEVTEE